MNPKSERRGFATRVVQHFRRATIGAHSRIAFSLGLFQFTDMTLSRPIDRRQFLRQSAGVALGITAAGSAFAASEAPIVGFHVIRFAAPLPVPDGSLLAVDCPRLAQLMQRIVPTLTAKTEGAAQPGKDPAAVVARIAEAHAHGREARMLLAIPAESEWLPLFLTADLRVAHNLSGVREATGLPAVGPLQEADALRMQATARRAAAMMETWAGALLDGLKSGGLLERTLLVSPAAVG